MYQNQHKTKRSARHHLAQRRGVGATTSRSGFVLILVIVMLGLLAIVGVSFTHFATQEVQSASARVQGFSHHEEQGSVEQQLDSGLASVLVGSNNLHDFTHGHEILRDLYGGDGQQVMVRLVAQPPVKGVTRLRLDVDPTVEVPYFLMPLPGYYNGRQLVFGSGRFKGTSVRILNSDLINASNASNPSIETILVDVDSSFDFVSQDIGRVIGDAVIIGRPFNGGGMGVYPQGGVHFADANNDGAADDAISVVNARGAVSPYLDAIDVPDGLQDRFSPNFFYSGQRPESVWVPDTQNGVLRLIPYGGFDEDYDYPDFQNMFLGLVRHRLERTGTDGLGQPVFEPVAVVEQPSFHRPGMIAKLRQNGIDPWRHPVGRKLMLRPRPVDQRQPGINGFYGDPLLLTERDGRWNDIPHPGYDGVFGTPDDLHPGADGVYQSISDDGSLVQTNGAPIGDDRYFPEGFPAPYSPGLDLVYGTVDDASDQDGDGVLDGYRTPALPLLSPTSPARWVLDVDNDGDGMVDGVWVDLGKPVRTTTDGRRIKPLYSFLIVDLDSKLNLNAHGQLNRDQFNNASGAGGVQGANVVDNLADSHLSVHPSINPVLPNDDLPVGSGWSVAEINLQNVFPQAGTGNLSRANLEYLQVLAGKVGNPNAEPPRKIVKGRYGEYNMLWDQDSDGLPDQDINGDSRVDYPGPGYSQLYPQFSDQVKWDDDRPGDWFTRFVYAGFNDLDQPGGNYTTASRFHGDLLEGTVWKPIINGIPTGEFIPRWYRNPPDFDGDGTIRMNPMASTLPGGGLLMGWPSYGPSPDGSLAIGGTTPLELTWGWGGQLLDLGLENEKGWGVINPNNQTWRPGERGSENSNEPDEINLVRRQDAPDAIYGAEDLSWLHLAHDLSGSELVSRLSELAPFTFGTARYSDTNDPIRPLINRFAARNRRLVTTDSWDLAGFSAPPASNADWLPANWGGPGIQIFRPGQGSGTPGVGSVTGNFLSGGEVDRVAARLFFQIVPEEIKAGFRLDLNRPLGDGIDNPTPGAPNGNGVIDEDLEAGFDTIDNDGDGYNNEQRGEPGAIGPGFPDGRDNDGDALIDEADELVEDIRGPGSNVSITEPRKHVPGPRQRFARDIYILLYLVAMNPGNDQMMGTVDDTPRFVVPPGFEITGLVPDPLNPGNPNLSGGAADYLAQLAVNIVDFRDADSLMTGFEYDRWPGGGRGWDVNGNLIHDGDLQNNSYPPERDYYTARGVAWGVEKPELLINETLSFYDTRNQEEWDDEVVPEGQESAEYDQSYVWVELYNPNDPNHPGYPSVDLSEMAPRGMDLATDFTDEVWRLVVSQPAGPLPTVVVPPTPNTLATQAPNATGKPYLHYDSSSQNRPVKVVFRASPPVGTDNQPYTSSLINLNSAKYGSTVPSTGSFVLPGNQYLSVGSQALIGSGAMVELPNAWPNSQYVVNQERDLGGALPPDVHFDTGLQRRQNQVESAMPRRGAYLQRLANPTRPWHEQANPYVTIDAMQLKVYLLDSTDTDDDPVNPTHVANETLLLQSFERWMPFVGRARDRWGSENTIPSIDDYQGARDILRQGGGGGGGGQQPRDSLGFVNAYTLEQQVASLPFPWFAFNDRMFATPTELMQVPGTRPERLTNEFSTWLAWVPDGHPNGAQFPAEFYRPAVYADGTPVVNPKPFPHLIQWMESEVKASQNQSTSQTGTGLYRFFEFVEVPSRFNGVDENRNADAYQPPYHYRRGHRVPGKVNLNTVYEPEVFAGTFNNHPGVANNQSSSMLWNYLKAGDDSNLALPGKDLRRDGWSVNNPQVPGTLNFWATGDDRPFRSYAFGASPQGDIHDTLFRELRLGLQPTDPSSFLFDWLYPSFVTQQPEWGDTTPGQHTPFRFQLLQKLGNAVTTRSNVFAIWVTVGYFEVLHEPYRDDKDNDGDVLNQDGDPVAIPGVSIDEPDELLPRLGQELGYQTGDVTRHRAFYVVDRSRSSGWHPELKIDPSEMILVRKIIE